MPLRTRSLLLFQNHFPSPATMLQAELLLMVLMVQALRASQAPSLKDGKQIVTFQKSFSNNIYWLKTAARCINKIAVSVIFREHVKSNKVQLSQVCHTKHLHPRVFQGNLDSGFRKGTSDLMKTLYLTTFHCLWDKKKQFFPSSWFPAAEVRQMHAASSGISTAASCSRSLHHATLLSIFSQHCRKPVCKLPWCTKELKKVNLQEPTPDLLTTAKVTLWCFTLSITIPRLHIRAHAR